MKKIIALMLSLVLVVTLSGCADYAENTEPGGSANIEGLGIYTVQHISGEGHETPRPVKVLFEYKMLGYTKYQIAFLACT